MPAANSTFSSFPHFVDASESMCANASMARFQHRRKASAEHNAAMRTIISSWGSIGDSPLACNPIMYASWRKFSSGNTNAKAAEDMKASNLFVARGTIAEFNPPLLETTYLGVEQHSFVGCGRPSERDLKRRKCSSDSSRASSFSTVSTNPEGAAKAMPINFDKQALRPAVTNSLITKSMQSRGAKGRRERCSPMEMLARAMGDQTLNAEMLPSAFDSDSEDEDDEI